MTGINFLYTCHILHRLLNLSGDNSASGSPLLSRLDEKCPAAVADDLMNIGLANDLLLLEELPPPPDKPSRTLDSDNGKNPPLRRRENGDFIPL